MLSYGSGLLSILMCILILNCQCLSVFGIEVVLDVMSMSFADLVSCKELDGLANSFKYMNVKIFII